MSEESTTSTTSAGDSSSLESSSSATGRYTQVVPLKNMNGLLKVYWLVLGSSSTG